MHIPVAPAARLPRIQLADTDYELVNVPIDHEQHEDVTEYFSLTARSNTRFGRRAPDENDITAPMLLKRLRYPFVLAEVTVSVDFQVDWDQGGLAIFAGGHPTHHQLNQLASRSLRRPYVVVDPSLRPGPSKWARVAFEVNAGEPNITTLVANPKCAVDWACTPAFSYFDPAYLEETSMPSIRLKLERVGSDLWVWFMVPSTVVMSTAAPTPAFISRQWRKCREIVNFFDPESSKGGFWVGCYASRPVDTEGLDTNLHNGGLFVEFEDLEIL